VARTDPGYPRLLVLNDPLQRVYSLLLFQGLLLKLVQALQDQSHVNAHLVDVNSMTVNPLGNMIDLLLVVLEDLLFGNYVGSEIRLQSITLKASSIRGSTARKDGAYLSLKSKVLR